ncbi:MAG: aldehyde ferredoxin oxidoreductase family protein [Pseudomonadota bacterium]
MSRQYGGYLGKILHVDLNEHKMVEEAPGDKLYENFIGGYGLGARIIYRRQKAKVDPLGPDNILGLVTGPLTGTPAITGSRWAVVGKSPLTETWGDSNGGGLMGAALKSAGFDAVFFSGVAEKPVYLFINDGKAELRDAGDLWGRDTDETNRLLKKELGKGVQVACIGQGGENCSLISGVVTDGGRICARSGLGAVMGSKKLKAVVAIGSREIPVKDRERAQEIRKKYLRELKDNLVYKALSKFGTCAFTPGSTMSGDAGVKNWKGAAEVDYPADPNILGGEKVTSYQRRKYGCYKCPIACGGIVSLEKGPIQIRETHKPEYETMAVFGPMCLNVDTETIIIVNHLCNIYGLDTLSVGGTLAFAMECYEKGLITKSDTGGIELSWGNTEAMIRIIEMMAKREGFGAILADGSRKAAERIGKGAAEYAMQVQGEEFPMHGALFAPGYAVQWTMDATPGRHTQGGYSFVERYSKFMTGLGLPEGVDKYTYTGRGEWAVKLHNIIHIVASSGLCLLCYLALNMNSIPDFMNAIIGWQYSLDDLFKVGERISNIRQAFNIREGLNPLNFKLPGRVIGNPPLEKGPVAGVTIDVDTQIRDFLKAHDWDLTTAKPSKKKLLELGLEDVVNDLYPE